MYTSASGMLAQAARHDTIANNLANVSTPGFKQDAVMMRQYPQQFLHRLSDNLFSFKGFTADLAPAIGMRGQGTMIDSILPNFKQGSIINTENKFDFALTGEGWFTVNTLRGRRFTRAGNFSLDRMGRLVTRSGDPVLSSTGAEIFVAEKRLDINKNGVIYLDGEEVGKLAVVIPSASDMLVKEGENLYAPVAGARFGQADCEVVQGSIEGSNVNAMLGMAEMLEALRAYEANQRAIQAQDETLNRLISEVGRFG